MATNQTGRYPFAFLDQATLERRLDAPESIKGDYGLTDDEWSDLVDDVIAEETAWVGGVITDGGVVPGEYPTRDAFLAAFPEVRRAMVRLCRASIHEIEQDGLKQESAEDRSEIYRPPQAIRDEVRAELTTADPADAPDDLWVVSVN